MSDDIPAALRVTVDEVASTIAVLRLEPGDLLVLRARQRLNAGQKELIHNVIAQALEKAGINAPCLVIDKRMQFDVVRGAHAPGRN